MIQYDRRGRFAENKDFKGGNGIGGINSPVGGFKANGLDVSEGGAGGGARYAMEDQLYKATSNLLGLGIGG